MIEDSEKEATPLLKIENVSKSFPGVRALNNVSFTLEGGSVHALMGENGAGKSTLMKCLFGVYKKDSGRIFLDGQEVDFKSSADALTGGVAMVHQELSQAMSRSVMDNMFLGRFPKISKYLPFTSERAIYEETARVFEDLKINIDPRAKIESLSVSKRQMVEIAKAVSFGARVIVFDEPTSSLNENEAERLFEIIATLKGRGCGIIYISHKMDEIMRICDRITIMRDGERIDTRELGDITSDEIIKLMVGRTLSERYPKKHNTPGEPLLTVKNLSSSESGLYEVSFTLRRGEILGVAGLDGSGRSELLESIFGLREIDRGEIILNSRTVNPRSAKDAIKKGLALVTEERRRDGIFANLSITENTVISSLREYIYGPFLSDKMMRKQTQKNIRTLGIKTPNQSVRIESLSGGNQQKVILGRWLLTSPEVLMLDEPTRGIDVGAKYEIYKLIIELAASGKGIIAVSSEMPELLGICDRIIVMSGRRIAGEIDIGEATQEKIMELCAKFA